MSRRRKKQSAPGPKPKTAAAGSSASPGKTRVTGWKLWSFRLGILIAAPVLFFGLVELCLRLAGFGYSTSFLLPDTNGGRRTFVQNNRFGWRFFGAQMSRLPAPCSIPETKPADTVRVFVFGESAAYGDPQPRFGLPRMLEALLSLRHPGTRFEVVNAAMTGINSHTVLPIARDCAKANGDIWVIYMGNNEVVGPFGAGTVFGPQVPPLPMIRAGLAVKSSRTGQLIDSWRQKIQKPPADKSEWGGMVMFLGHQVPADDPRMAKVYAHFERNLADIIYAGRNSGVGIVVSTVGVNLRDCAPFASAHRAGLSADEQKRWEEIYQRGIEAEDAGKLPDAAAHFNEAAQIDDRVAELRFRQGRCALALGDTTSAQKQFSAARDLDTLRFRCDSRLNEATRRIAGGREAERVRLADAERAFAEFSANGVTGQEFFYEHVHLTFEGNYVLARTIAAEVEKLLPEKVTARAGSDWPVIADCARRLAWSDWALLDAVSEVRVRAGDPPFTGQLGHEAAMRRLDAWIAKLAPAGRPAGIEAARKSCDAALVSAPDDPTLLAMAASLRQLTGDLPGGAEAAQRATVLLPSSSANWMALGAIFAQQRKFEDAVAAFRKAFAWDSQDVWALQNLAQALVKVNRREEAIAEYRRALALKPRFGLAWIGLGQLLEETGRTNEANDCFQKALANRIHRATELTTLARFCRSRGWFEAAATNYVDALRLSPADAGLHVETGQTLEAAGRHGEAAQHYAEAARLNPDMLQAHYLLGMELGRQHRSAEAVEEFREAVRLMPDLPEARMNLGLALMNSGRDAEAMIQFEEVLRRSPTNAPALKAIQMLRSKGGG